LQNDQFKIPIGFLCSTLFDKTFFFKFMLCTHPFTLIYTQIIAISAQLWMLVGSRLYAMCPTFMKSIPSVVPNLKIQMSTTEWPSDYL
jgi:hypothetical protein